MNVMSRLWSEQDGFIVSAELLFIATLLVIGLGAGLAAVRDSVVTELADVAQAIANLNQTYQFGASVGHCGVTGPSQFFDAPDFCDLAAGGAVFQTSKCVVVCNVPGLAFPGQDGQ